RIESQYLRAGNGIQRFLLGFVVKDGNVGLAVQYLKIAHGKVENIHDPVVIVITEHDRLRGRVRVRVRQYGQGDRRTVRAPELRGNRPDDRLRGVGVLVGGRVHNGVAKGIEPGHRHGRVAAGNKDILRGQVEGRDLVRRGTALQFVIAERIFEGPIVNRYGIHDERKLHDVITSL